VELHVLRGLAGMWDVTLPADPVAVARAAACGNAEMQHVLAECGLINHRDLATLDEARQLQVVRRLSRTITSALGVAPVEDGMVQATCPQAIARLSVKQAWIYRDWQQAIGTLMIRPIDGAARRFDVIDYGTFERMFTAAGGDERPWMERLEAVLVDIDVATADPADFRVAQLRAVARALAALVCAIERLDLERRILDGKACELARKLLAAIPPREAE
jgi:hypothetical protein